MPNGHITKMMIGPPYAGTSTGRCIVEHFRAVEVAPFAGPPVALNHVFLSIPY
jgi:hypothetical protein